jgi:hypothetical protein
MMARSGASYAIKAMERVAMGTAAAGPLPMPGGQAVDDAAPASTRRDGGTSSILRPVLAAMGHTLGGALGRAARGRQRLSRALRSG